MGYRDRPDTPPSRPRRSVVERGRRLRALHERESPEPKVPTWHRSSIRSHHRIFGRRPVPRRQGNLQRHSDTTPPNRLAGSVAESSDERPHRVVLEGRRERHSETTFRNPRRDSARREDHRFQWSESRRRSRTRFTNHGRCRLSERSRRRTHPEPVPPHPSPGIHGQRLPGRRTRRRRCGWRRAG